jgi:hypothetical protein
VRKLSIYPPCKLFFFFEKEKEKFDQKKKKGIIFSFLFDLAKFNL